MLLVCLLSQPVAMVSGEWAVRVVEQYLAEWAERPGGPALVVADVGPHRLGGWVIVNQGGRYLRTRSISDMLSGHGYVLFDGMDGGLLRVHAIANLELGQ